jgi:hypothetical protein
MGTKDEGAVPRQKVIHSSTQRQKLVGFEAEKHFVDSSLH